MTTLERRLDHMRKLVALDAPAPIKADFFVHVLMPQIAAEIGIQDVMTSLAKFMAQGVARYKGICWVCLNKPQARGDDVCPKCQAETDQWIAAMEAAMNDDDAGDDA